MPCHSSHAFCQAQLHTVLKHPVLAASLPIIVPVNAIQSVFDQSVHADAFQELVAVRLAVHQLLRKSGDFMYGPSGSTSHVF